MWPGFNVRRAPVLMALVILVLPAMAQQLVYNLQQDWLYYNDEHRGFLPVDENNLNIHAVSFSLADPEFDPFYLTIGVTNKSYLFHRTQLVATLPVGITSFRVDSLRQTLASPNLFLTVYGENLLPYLITEVRTSPVFLRTTPLYEPTRFANSFSNFFYFAATILALIFVLLKTKYADLMNQYLLFQRALRFKTIDELIYKIPYLGFPNILFLAFITLIIGFIMISIMYLFPGSIITYGLNPKAMGFGQLLTGWLTISGTVLLALISKYLLTFLVSSTFDLKISNYHFASFLRLLFIMVIILLLLVGMQFVIVGVVPPQVYWLVLLLGIAAMEAILFLKLSLLTSHTLLYIFVYLCATEIIPIALMLKFITG